MQVLERSARVNSTPWSGLVGVHIVIFDILLLLKNIAYVGSFEHFVFVFIFAFVFVSKWTRIMSQMALQPIYVNPIILL